MSKTRRRCEWCADSIEHKNADARFCGSKCKARAGYWRTDRAIIAERVARHRERRREPEYCRQAKLKRRAKAYGITVDQILDLLSHPCFICGRAAEHIDHDHACCPGITSCGRCVRGALCRECNLGLGAFEDRPERLRMAVHYLTTRTPHHA